MPAVALERVTSGQAAAGEQPSVTLAYVVQGAADRDEALAAVAAEAPVSLGGLVRKSWRVEPEADGEWWTATVEYGWPGKTTKETGESEFQFDTGGSGAVHMTVALEHIADYPSGAPNHGGVINVRRGMDGIQVEGVDVTPPADALAFSVVRYQSTVNLGALYALSRTTNNASWTLNVDGVSATFAAREAIFLGASGSKRGRGDWSVRYGFCASPTVNDLTIGGITGIVKAGTDYVWVEDADTTDPAANALVKKPIAAHVERVWRLGNFAALGIPSGE